MTKYEKILDFIGNFDTEEMIAAHNEMCSNDNDIDNYIYSMEEFDEIMCEVRPWQIARACYYGEFCPARDYWKFDGCDNLVSFDYWKDPDADIYPEDIADYIYRTENDMGYIELQEILEED